MRDLKLKPHYDLVVIGGGIQGCAMLWEAQSRGLNTLVVETQDYCSQTSANSLKTIHGGIRYLQTLNLSRTWRSAKEQETLLRIAPHLVHPLPCLLPTERKLKRSRLAVTTGFSLYNLIKKFACPDQKLPKSQCLSIDELSRHTELLNSENVTGAGLWHDAQVQHAERLGLAFVKTAQAAGADAYNYLKAVSFSTKQDQQFQLTLVCQISTQKKEVTSDSIIFCTASETVENLSGQVGGDYPKFCLAVNLVVKNRYSDMAIGLQSGFAQKSSRSSNRLLFAAPWRDSTLFGTWYFDSGSKTESDKAPNKQQLDFCLADINRTYPGASFMAGDVMAVHAGLLPVKGETSNPENNLMEEDLIHRPDADRNLLVVIPSKYTTCRATAERTIDQLAENTGKNLNPSVSSVSPLIGAETIDDIDTFLLESLNKYHELFSGETIKQLVVAYGDKIDQIAELCKQNNELAELIPGSENHIKAQLEYELRCGQVELLDDFVVRRSFLAADSALNESTLDYSKRRINKFHATDVNTSNRVENC